MNPLQKYFRQPKLFVSLPSKGLFYEPGAIEGDCSNVPIFAMTGMDEIIMKTPDALFTGDATVKLIESCCPYIKNGRKVPSLDVDVLLVAIRLSTYGEDMNVSHTCKSCGSQNDYIIKLTKILEQYQDKVFDSKIAIDEITVNLKPLTYEDMSRFNIENFKLQKMLSQLVDVTVEEKQKYLDEIYQRLGQIQVDVFISSIESIQTPTDTVIDKEHIKEWLLNTVKTSYNQIKNKLEENKADWSIPKFPIKCSDCAAEDNIDIVMDQSNFFA